jgi:alkanesulfonate monooxygenase SsuD/methylene tetrahydromethanopterin reductase-like flavin-dependent oxidoreductase (luciferase family)
LSWREFEHLGISMDEARGRYEEVLKVLRLAFTQERFSFHGEFYDVENVMIRPRPLDPSVVLDAYGVWTSDESMAVAARMGLNPVTIPSKSLVDFRAQMDKYDEWRAEAGFGPAKRPIVQLFLMCHEDSDTAHELASRYFTEYVESAVWHYDFGGERLNRQPGYESYNTSGTSSYLSGGQKKAAEGLAAILLGEGLIGPPEECLESLRRVKDMMDPAEVVLIAAHGTIDPEMAKRSMTLFAEALPEIRRWSSVDVPAATKA